jgi:hypothetical protein
VRYAGAQSSGSVWSNHVGGGVLVNRALGFTLAGAALVAASCGGGTTSSVSPTTRLTAGRATSTSAIAATSTPGGSSGKATTGKVLVRIVNYYAPPGHPGGESIEGYVPSDANPNPQEGVGTPDIASTAYATTSDYRSADPSKVGNVLLFAAGHSPQLADVNVDGTSPGRITYVLGTNDSGQLTTTGFFERPSETQLADPLPGILPGAPAGKVLLVAVATPLMSVTPKVGYNLGQPGKGCFALQTPDAPNSGGQTNIPSGGSLQYLADAGTLSVAYFDSADGQCTGAPAIGPIPMTVGTGDRAYVIAYGTTPTDLHLSALNIPVMPGDPPLLPAPSTTVPTAFDVCSLVTPAEAASALGAKVTATKPDATQGTCEYDAGDASVQITAVIGGGGTAFEMLMSGATSAQPVSGLGDRGFTTTDPANSIVIQEGDNLLGIGLSHTAAGGAPDDPATDRPLLRSLATKALGRMS